MINTSTQITTELLSFISFNDSFIYCHLLSQGQTTISDSQDTAPFSIKIILISLQSTSVSESKLMLKHPPHHPLEYDIMMMFYMIDLENIYLSSC